MPDPKYQIGDIIKTRHSDKDYLLVKNILITQQILRYSLYDISGGNTIVFDIEFVEKHTEKV
jgi:hypothetical protein